MRTAKTKHEHSVGIAGAGLLEEDHTLDVLDATIMAAIFLLLISLLLVYGALS